MRIEINYLPSVGVWNVRLGLIEENFLVIETAVKWIQEKMIEHEESQMRAVQDTSGT